MFISTHRYRKEMAKHREMITHVIKHCKNMLESKCYTVYYQELLHKICRNTVYMTTGITVYKEKTDKKMLLSVA